MEKLYVDNSKCIGCGLCVSMNEDYFTFNDDGLSEAKKTDVNEEDKKELLSIIESCPASAISIEEK